MKRALMLATATMAWVVALQFVSGAVAPNREIDLAESWGPRGGSNLAQINMGQINIFGVDLLLPTGLPTSSPSPSRPGITPDLSSRLTTPVPGPTATSVILATTTSTAAPLTTTTTTRAPAATTTTTKAPAPTTTASPATTAPPPVTTAPAAGAFNAAAESDFVGRINGLRGSVGVDALGVNGELSNYARWWAQQMATTGNFAHSDIGSLLDPWTIVGENIGYGGSVEPIFNALVNSPGHYKNMVEGRFTAVGVGVFVDASGRMWTAHVFGG